VIEISPKRMEEAAEAGRALVAGLPGAGLIIVDTEMRIRLVDGDGHDTLTHQGSLGRLMPDVIPAAAWSVIEPHYRRALAGLAQSFVCTELGTRLECVLRMAPIRDRCDVVGVTVLTEDAAGLTHLPPPRAETEPMQHAVLEVMEEGVVVVSPQGRLIQANHAAGMILGTDLDSARADPDWWRSLAATHTSDGSTVDIGASVLETGFGVRDVDVDARRRDGTRVSLSVNYQALRDSSGAVSGLVLSFRDVTEHQHEHRRLAASHERLRAAHQVARLASWELDPETEEVVIFQALPGDEASLGKTISLTALLGDRSPDEQQQTRADLEAVVRGDLEVSVRRSARVRPSGALWLETRAQAVRDPDGQLICIRGTTQDVTEQERAKLETASARDFSQATLDSLSANIAVLDDHGEVVSVNRAWSEFADANGGMQEGPGANYLEACDLAGDDEYAVAAAAGLRAITSGVRHEFALEYPCHSPTTERWYMLRAVRFEGPGDARVVVSHEDVTERRQAVSEMATQAALLDEVDVAVVATDLNGLITHWNRGAEQLYGWTVAEAIGQVGTHLLTPPGTDTTCQYVQELLTHGRAGQQLTLSRKDGSTFPASVRGRVMLDEKQEPTGRINVSVDISEQVASERALASVRNYMRAVADSIGEGVFTLDNDGRLIYMNAAAEQLLGWTGDELVSRVMHDVIHAVRPDGTDLPIGDCPILRARRDGQTMRIEDDAFTRRDGRQLPVSYTASPFQTEDGVGGCVVVFADISQRKAHEANLQREADKLSWIGRIQDALAEGRFMLYAQPIVDLGSGASVQHELLLRMRGRDGEIVPPGAYLPIAEQYGLIGDIDRWVIAEGIEIAGTGLPVEINLSALSVGDRGTFDHIETCLHASRADPADIVFEITETAIVGDEQAARIFAERLRTLGCKLALDDFGTGYGGFTYLKQLPIDYLKIDIEFVRDLVTNPGSRHVVEAVVALADGFDLKTVAEGVEDAETGELLVALGVDFAQGYHFARPAPIDDCTRQAGAATDGAPSGR